MHSSCCCRHRRHRQQLLRKAEVTASMIVSGLSGGRTSARFGGCISWANEKKGVSFILNSSFIPLVILIIALKLLLLLSLSSTIAWTGGGEGDCYFFGVIGRKVVGSVRVIISSPLSHLISLISSFLISFLSPPLLSSLSPPLFHIISLFLPLSSHHF